MFNKPTRNHITVILEQIGAVGVVLLTGSFSALLDILERLKSGVKISSLLERAVFGETQLLVILAVALLGIIMTVWLILRWKKTAFYIDEDYLVVEKNTFFNRSSRVPLSGISTVNLERSVFERMVGTAKIKLDINSAATANQTDFTFVLSHEKAKAFENELISRKQASDGKEGTAVSRRTVCSFTAVHALRDALLGQQTVWLIAFAALLALGIPAESFFLSGADLNGTVSVTSFMALSLIFRVAMQFASAYGFKMEKDENSFYISSGLLKKKNYSFESEKVNALIIRQPPLARIFGLYRAEVAVVGLGNDKNETPQICLLVKRQELERIVAVCAPDFSCEGKPGRSHTAGLLASVSFYVCFAAAVAVAASFVHILLSAVAVAVGAVTGVMSWRCKTVAADARIFSYSKGVLSKKVCYFKYGAVQTARLCTNPLMKRLGAGEIQISILSSSAVSLHLTGWVAPECFDALVGQMLC